MTPLLTIILTCAPFVAPDTLLSIIQVESRNNPWAIGVNGNHRFKPAQNFQEAVAESERLIAAGANIDMGLMQINSTTMRSLGLTVGQVFDPCTNVYAGASILTRNYVKAQENTDDEQAAVQAALSAYNTGNFTGGYRNGYVSKVVKNALSR